MRALVGLAVLACACADTTSDAADAAAGHYEIRHGTVESSGESYDELEAPSAAAVGTEVIVRVWTVGSSCTGWYADDVAVYGDRAVLTPWDITFVPPTHPPDADEVTGCPSDLRRFEHRFSFRFTTPGDKQLEIRGRSVGPRRDVPKILRATITITD